ncbi:MAG: peptidoglycan editing factor PgeF [Dongiaceae bacterium]
MITADALTDCRRVRHAFFTRLGGVSEGVYDSLNCGLGSGDETARVQENRRRAMALVELPAEALATAYQVHSPDVAVVERPWTLAERPKVDAMVTTRPGMALGISTADCVPVLFADAAAGVIGAAHAGWRGAIGGVLEATVAAMQTQGARGPRIHAAIGPCIAQPSYEVGPEFPAPFLEQDADNARFFIASTRAGHFMFDLPGYVASRLARLGLGSIDDVHCDTCAEADLFFSYRRTTLQGEPDYGRGLSVIALDK